MADGADSGDLPRRLPSPSNAVCSRLQAAKPSRIVVVTGPPGAGKGTQCDRIVSAYGLVHISPGEILRDHVRRGTELGAHAKQFMDRGELVPSDVVIQVIAERLGRSDVAKRGALLDNFPLTANQARAMKGRIDVDVFIALDVAREALVERTAGRRMDPQTGAIYHLRFNPPPPEVMARLEVRSDDVLDLVTLRLDTHMRHIDSILPLFDGVHHIDGMQDPDTVSKSIAAVLDARGWGVTEDEPYTGSKAFGGRFSDRDAKRGGFFSASDPPEVGEEVVCFRRGADWRKRGRVVDSDVLASDGSCGLMKGIEGVMTTVERKDGQTFSSWSAFLAPVNDMEYSSIIQTAKFQVSKFSQLYSCAGGLADVDVVPKEAARSSLQEWLQNIEDADGEPMDVCEEAITETFEAFDTHENPSLYVYSMNIRLGRRTSLVLGQDYSIYFRALNNALNSDHEHILRPAMPLIQHMIRDLLYREDGARRLHAGGRVWKGDTQRPVPLNIQKLVEAEELGTVVRFRQFQSTSTDEKLAEKYRRREDSRGFLWTIDIPAGFWGARDISDIAWRKGESETLFPPYAAFLVRSINDEGCHLEAVDRATELTRRAERHGLKGTAVELLDY